MGKPKPHAPPECVALYGKLISTIPGVEMKGAANPYTSINGHMFSFLTREGILALRLPREERELFLKKFKTQLCVQYGTVMKEYVEVPAALFGKTGQVKKYFVASLEYVGSLKPKPTTSKKRAKAGQASTKVAGKKKAASNSKVTQRDSAHAAAKKKPTKRKQADRSVGKPSIKKQTKKKARKKK